MPRRTRKQLVGKKIENRQHHESECELETLVVLLRQTGIDWPGPRLGVMSHEVLARSSVTRSGGRTKRVIGERVGTRH